MTLETLLTNWSTSTGGDTPTVYIKTEFNKLSTLGVAEMTDEEASGLYYVLENRLTKLLPCSTIYDTDEEGITGIKRILKYNLYSFVTEIRNMVKAISKDIATTHSRAKFNPIDNTDIDNAADESDLQSFSYVNNMMTQVDYLNENSRTLGKIYRDFASICYIIGTTGSTTSSGTSGDYVTKTTFNQAVNAITEALSSEAETRSANDLSLAESIDKEAETRADNDSKIISTMEEVTKELQAVDATLEQYCESLDATKAPQSDLEAEVTRATNAEKEIEAKIPTKYVEEATVSGNTLKLQNADGTETSFTPTGTTGGITDVQITDTEGTSSVVSQGVANIDLTGYMTTTNANTRFSEVETLITDEQNRAMEMENELQNQIDNLKTMVSTTYSELVSLRDNSQLVAGNYYRITDYVATTTQDNTQATTNQYDIIVLATSSNTLNEEARAIQHSGDTYFANSNLNKWKVWYSLDNNSVRYAWADTTNGKGIVYRLIDEFDNDIKYDFKLIQVKNNSKSDKFYYLFDNNGVDASLNTSTLIYCYSNHFGNYVTATRYYIGCNIIYGGYNIYSNTIGDWFYNNTIGGNFFSRNIIGHCFYNNTIGDGFDDNTIGNGFGDNTIGNYFYDNTIGNDFDNNTTTSLSSQLHDCTIPAGMYKKITTSTTLERTSKTTFYIGSDGSLKSLD